MEDYKAGQGSLTRLVTWMTLLGAVFLGCVEVYSWIYDPASASLIPLEWFESLPFFGVPFNWQFIVCIVLFGALIWATRWFMHRPQTVDTLIETEQEMKKVSWPTKDESLNATWIVMLVTVVLTLSLWLFDGGLRIVLSLVF